ncbi:MAG TPA: hydrogenase/urease maturation nickel metallochaperone HypA [Candidatus Omnitrophota bacterium]|nr:hydrogenase/urease maturation nickel metallochaperone HypA [Candidatus Omnitrophota bacterium]HQO37214.1 hydrogenase/urease maturation nickel metallochaperone HypA [Candidatus Omnitrophota bacterium]HQQ05391.1 hydrogenase/urease maturation nickel metallochaperone HypA [Candidatus Omnitrophota bacterium]
MEEQRVVENLVRQILEEANKRNAARVTKVHLALGEVLGFDADAIKRQYQEVTRGTLAEGSEIDVRWEIAGRDIYIEKIEVEEK